MAPPSQVAAIVEVALETYREWSRDRTIRLGAGLAYYGLFAVIPFLVVAIMSARLVFSEERIADELASGVDSIFGSGGDDFSSSVLESVRVSESSGMVGLIAVAALLVTASVFAVAFYDAVVLIWGAEFRRGIMATLRRRLLGMGAVLLLSAFLGTTLVVQSVGSLVETFEVGPFDFVAELVVAGATLTLLALGLGLVFAATAPETIRAKTWMTAAVITALAAVVGTWVLGFYLRSYGANSATTAASGVVIGLLWMYYEAQILLGGVELTKVLHRRGDASLGASGSTAE